MGLLSRSASRLPRAVLLALLACPTLIAQHSASAISPRTATSPRANSTRRVAANWTQDAELRAAVVRATIIFKLAAYLHPNDAAARKRRPYRIVIVGSDLTGRAIAARLKGRSVRKRSIKIEKHPLKAATADKLRSADLIYIAKSVGAAETEALIKQQAHTASAMVCERPGFAALGGSVQLFVSKNVVRFEVNHGALKQQGIKASPQLLKLSRRGPRR